jgi:hypothetical protein
MDITMRSSISVNPLCEPVLGLIPERPSIAPGRLDRQIAAH